MFGLELLFGIGIAIIAAVLLSVFIAFLLGAVIAIKDIVDKRRKK